MSRFKKYFIGYMVKGDDSKDVRHAKIKRAKELIGSYVMLWVFGLGLWHIGKYILVQIGII